MSKKGVKQYPAQLAVKCADDALEAFLKNVTAIGSTKDIVVREMVRAFNEACEGDARPALPPIRLQIVSPRYRIEEGRVVEVEPTPAPTNPQLGGFYRGGSKKK